MNRRLRVRFSVFPFVGLLICSKGNLLGQTDPFFAIEPTNRTVVAGSDVTFASVAGGTPPFRYQWQFSGNDILGATTSNLTLTNVQPEQAGLYRVGVTNDLAAVTSSNAQLTVLGPYTVATLAGWAGKSGTNDGTGIEARFYYPAGIVVDPGGTVFVSEYVNHTIRRISPDGVVTTFAGSAGIIGTNDGPGLSARFRFPEGLAMDPATNIYVADNFNHTIRKISPDGIVSTLAGLAGVPGTINGTGSAALFYQPNGIVLDASGNLYVSEWGRSGAGDVRKVTPGGTVSTVVSGLNSATGIARDPAGNFYVPEQFGNRIRKIVMPGAVLTPWQGLNNPYGGMMDAAGNFYLAGGDHAIRVIPPSRGVGVLAGVLGVSGSDDGLGTAARFNSFRSGITMDTFGNLYVADNLNHTIRKAVPFAIPVVPRSQGVPAGSSATLEVSAAPPESCAYQWSFSGSALAGQTNTSLTLGPVWRSNSGVYSVAVTNSLGTWIRFNAIIRALVTPTIESIQFGGGSNIHLEFRDVDGGVPFDTNGVRVQFRTDLPGSSDTGWQTFTSSIYLVDGVMMFDDTTTPALPSRFYRVLEQ